MRISKEDEPLTFPDPLGLSGLPITDLYGKQFEYMGGMVRDLLVSKEGSQPKNKKLPLLIVKTPWGIDAAEAFREHLLKSNQNAQTVELGEHDENLTGVRIGGSAGDLIIAVSARQLQEVVSRESGNFAPTDTQIRNYVRTLKQSGAQAGDDQGRRVGMVVFSQGLSPDETVPGLDLAKDSFMLGEFTLGQPDYVQMQNPVLSSNYEGNEGIKSNPVVAQIIKKANEAGMTLPHEILDYWMKQIISGENEALKNQAGQVVSILSLLSSENFSTANHLLGLSLAFLNRNESELEGIAHKDFDKVSERITVREVMSQLAGIGLIGLKEGKIVMANELGIMSDYVLNLEPEIRAEIIKATIKTYKLCSEKEKDKHEGIQVYYSKQIRKLEGMLEGSESPETELSDNLWVYGVERPVCSYCDTEFPSEIGLADNGMPITLTSGHQDCASCGAPFADKWEKIPFIFRGGKVYSIDENGGVKGMVYSRLPMTHTP